MPVDVTDLRRAVNDLASDLFTTASKDLLAETQAKAPFRTGRTITSGKLLLRPESGGTFTGTLLYDPAIAPFESYASYTDEGTRGPYEIRAKNAKVLAFQSGGQTIFRVSVQHPGITGTRWFSGTADEQGWVEALAAAGSGLTVT